jgi:hypothetical protein
LVKESVPINQISIRGCGAGCLKKWEGIVPSGIPIRARIAKLISLIGAALLCVPTGGASAGTELSFPQPPAIQDNVKFWIDVFATYGVRDFIIHDRDQVDRVYQVMHLPGDGDPTRQEVNEINDYLKAKYVIALNHLAAGQPPANAEEQHVADLFNGEPMSAYAAAAQNLRVQQGLRERFRDGLLRSKYYRPTMERIFRGAGLPPELVTLATVESGFYSKAKSSAGAVGIWQFTRGTGKEYMRISRYHDDRFDPTTETRAAAALFARTTTRSAAGRWRSPRTITGPAALRRRRPSSVATTIGSCATSTARASDLPRGITIRSFSPLCRSIKKRTNISRT